jgi:CRP-like cAMP-binding protein/rhodanese-related sulfurtransferase
MPEANKQFQERIKELIPINELPQNLQTRLLERAKILEVKKSKFLFKQGDKDDYSYYLLEGELELHANKQLDSVIQSDSDRAKYALAQLQPRQFSAKAKTPLKILMIERNNLDQLMVLAQETTASDLTLGSGADMEVDIVDGVDDDTDWMTQMLQSELFSRMPMANIHQLFALLEPIEKKAGELVISQGESGEHYYIISEGRCAVSRKPSPKSNDVKLAELKVGDSFGEEALISESTRNATITMITDGVLMQLAKDTFVELVKNPTLQSLKFDEADALVNEGSAQWLDVRFPNEHQESSIKGSINIPLNSMRLQTDKLDSSVIYILYCDTGGRSSTGSFLLAERGFDVTYLDGGLVNNPEAVGVQTVVPKVSEPAKQAAKADAAPESKGSNNKEVDAEVRVEMLNAELETTQIRMAKAKAEESKDDTDVKKKKEYEENQKKLEEEREKLEKQKKLAEAEASKKAQQEEARLKKLEAESEKQMQQEKKKLEEIYNQNAKDMEKLQKAKEAAEEKIRKEREKLEQQAEAARKQIEEAKRIKEETEASKKRLEEVEASKRKLEQEAEKKRLEDEERERQLQAEAKAKIEEERKKLAEQYERNSKEFEELQKEKAATEAARVAAKKEAAKMIEEYKMSHDKTRAEEEAKLKAERLKLEEEAKQIQETMKQIQQTKLEAEKIKQDALEQASVLKEKQMDSTSSQAQRDKLETEIKAVEEKAIEAEREIEDAAHRKKLTESAQQVNEADLSKKKKQEEALRAQVEGDLEDFEEQQEEDADSITQVQMHSDMMKRIKAKAADAKKKAASANDNLLDDISKQLGNK